MKPCITIALFTGLLLGAPTGWTDEAAIQSRFKAANEAYDRGEYETALAGYRALIDSGYATMETWYNAANAHFRSGSVGQAVLYYRRGWYLNPRDPDVRANLELAQQRSGALTITPTLLDRAGQELSHREWTLVFKISYWTALISIVGAWWIKPVRRFLRPVAAMAGVAALAGFGGRLYWNHWINRSEAVVMAAKTALYEPREKATPFFTAPEGSLVLVEETFDSWVKVRSGQKAGWLPRSAVQPVYSWQREQFD